MEQATTKQKAFVGALIGKHEAKESIVLAHTGGRTVKISELTKAEASAIIKQFNKPKGQEVDNENVKRKKILHYAHLLKWEKEGGGVDMNLLNGFLLNKSGFGKTLNQLNTNELNKIITQLQRIYDKDDKKREDD
jgi:hypothetical protein